MNPTLSEMIDTLKEFKEMFNLTSIKILNTPIDFLNIESHKAKEGDVYLNHKCNYFIIDTTKPIDYWDYLYTLTFKLCIKDDVEFDIVDKESIKILVDHLNSGRYTLTQKITLNTIIFKWW